jgi:hypothetical protein
VISKYAVILPKVKFFTEFCLTGQSNQFALISDSMELKMKKIIINILLLALIAGIVYFGYTTFSNISTPSEKKTKTQIKTDFEPEIKILDKLKDFDSHGDFPINLDATKFGRDDPFAEY